MNIELGIFILYNLFNIINMEEKGGGQAVSKNADAGGQYDANG